jgi:hypothetical protein
LQQQRQNERKIGSHKADLEKKQISLALEPGNKQLQSEIEIDKSKATVSIGICPEYELNQTYFNNIFTGTNFSIKQQTAEGELSGADNHMWMVKSSGNDNKYVPSSSEFIESKIISVPDSGLVRDGSDIFRAKAGEAESLKY